MGVFCGDLLNIGCSEFKRAWKIWQPSIVVFWRLSRQLKCTDEQNCTEMTRYDISSLSASVETGVICTNAALQLWLDSHNLDCIQPKLYLEFNSFGTSCHLKEAIVLTTTWPDSVFKIFPFLFQLYNFNTNEDQALINKKLPKELILRYL